MISWIDLSNMFVYELGGKNSKITISGKDKQVNQDLAKHTGANTVRMKAFNDWRDGEGGKYFGHQFNYQLHNMAENLTGDWQWVEVFLGGYKTDLKVVKSGDVYTLTFIIENMSSTESLTRFRRENGKDVGMVKNRKRGTGWGLCGNFTQIYTWTESYKLVNGKFVPNN
jgi:hypothetical protein